MKILGLVLLCFCGVHADQFCRALALEGGGSLGAYQVGALMELAAKMPAQSIEWNVVTGVSTGALNAAGVSLFPMGQETQMAQFLKTVWLGLNGTSSIYENWNSLGPAFGLLNEAGMYSTVPLHDTLTQLVTHVPMRNFTVGSTNLNTGLFGTFNESLGKNIVEAVMCSAAPPLFFPPQNFMGTTWADGGCIINLDVFSAVERCLDVVASETDIVVDMIFCSGASLSTFTTTPTVFDVTSRVSSVNSYDSAMWFVYNAMQAYPKADFRFTIVPSASMPGGIVPLDFNRTVLQQEMQLGENDVLNILGTEHNPRKMAEDWKATRYNKFRVFKR